MTLFEFALLFLGVLIPFAWVPVVVWLLIRWARSRTSPLPTPAGRQGESAPESGEGEPADDEDAGTGEEART